LGKTDFDLYESSKPSLPRQSIAKESKAKEITEDPAELKKFAA
jgi:hypothetical protein